MRIAILSLCIAVAPLSVWAAEVSPSPAPRLEFNRDIRPILSDKCFACHGPDASHREADLRLDSSDGARADLGGRQAIVPGKPELSELVARITSNDPDERMPPAEGGKQLTKVEIELLRRWIAEGADYQPHWALVPPKRPVVPKVKQTDWPRNDIDRFILARLEKGGLAPSPEADPITLCRRLYLDLTGLPPTVEEVDTFVQSATRDPQYAIESLVDRLLASPHYGERMAMHWFDLVRFANTVGYHGDQEHAINPYRDWVIKAFNDNMPFDRFTAEQLAGDLLPEATVEQKIASGYNRLLQTSHEGGRAEEGISTQVRRRPRAELLGRVAGGHDGLLRVPRSQVRSLHATRLLQPGRCLRRRRRQPHVQRGRHHADEARAGARCGVAARARGDHNPHDGDGGRDAARRAAVAPRRLDGRNRANRAARHAGLPAEVPA